MDVGAIAAGWGYIGIIEREAKKAWEETGEDIFSHLVAQYEKHLASMSDALLELNPKGGRPNKHSDRLYRSKRPDCERLMPHGLDRWHRPTESY